MRNTSPFTLSGPAKKPSQMTVSEMFLSRRGIVVEYEIKIFLHCNSEICGQGLLCPVLLVSHSFTGIDQT